MTDDHSEAPADKNKSVRTRRTHKDLSKRISMTEQSPASDPVPEPVRKLRSRPPLYRELQWYRCSILHPHHSGNDRGRVNQDEFFHRKFRQKGALRISCHCLRRNGRQIPGLREGSIPDSIQRREYLPYCGSSNAKIINFRKLVELLHSVCASNIPLQYCWRQCLPSCSPLPP